MPLPIETPPAKPCIETPAVPNQAPMALGEEGALIPIPVPMGGNEGFLRIFALDPR
jgi:hypothetical protein